MFSVVPVRVRAHGTLLFFGGDGWWRAADATWQNSRTTSVADAASEKNEEEEAEEMIRGLGFIVVVKPRSSFLAKGARVCHPMRTATMTKARGHEGSSDKGFFCFIFQVIIECRICVVWGFYPLISRLSGCWVIGWVRLVPG